MTAVEGTPADDVAVRRSLGQRQTAIWRAWSWNRIAVGAIAVGVAYYLGALVGFALAPTPQSVSPVWPPNAILLGALLLAPLRAWPVMLLAALSAHFAVQFRAGVPLPMVAGWFISNSAEALIGAGALRWLSDGPIRFDSFRRVGIFVAFAGLAAPFLSSFLDVWFVQLNGLSPPAAYWDTWHVRFLSNVLAVLTLVPAIVTWGDRGMDIVRSVTLKRFIEGTLLTVSLLVVCTLVFVRPPLGIHATPALLCVPFPFLLWAAVRFGPTGASACLLIFAVLPVWGATHGQGPFVGPSAGDTILSAQLFLIVTYIPLIALAAVIRERAHAEGQVRRNEEQLNLALSAAQVGTWDWDLVENREVWSGKTREIFGLPVGGGELEHQDFLALVKPEDRPVLKAAIASGLDGSVPYEVEFRTVRADGSVRWVSSKGKVVHDASGRPMRMLGVCADVTERKAVAEALRDEASLRESETRLRQLADAMPQVVWTARPDGSIDYFNERWYQLTGTTPGPITHDTWLTILHPEDRVHCFEAWAENVRNGRPHEHEGRFWSAPTSSYRWHLARALPVRDESGAILHYYGTATDIDDRKRAEQALRESERLMRLLGEELEHRVAQRTAELSRMNAALREEIDVRVRVERALRASEERFAKAFGASPDAIVITREPECRIFEINERWEAMFGYTRTDAIGRTVDELGVYVHAHDNDRFREMMETQGYIRDLELDMRNSAGEILRAVIASEAVDVGGEPCLITMIRDITERQRAEHEIVVQRRQLAHLGRVAVLGELSGALAHELNQPLTAILANARAAQRMLLREHVDVPELRAILDDIVADDRRAGSVIHRVRALIRKGDTEPQPVVANEVVREVLDLANSDLIQRAVAVTTRLAPGLPPVPADRVQLQQVVLNLVFNACDAMADIPPSERTLTITTADEGTVIRVSVTDRGTGISGTVESVFEPFVTSKEHGLGLGLAICRSIVDAHGGRMWAVNNAGRGATFHLVLPKALVTAPIRPLASHGDASTAHKS